MSSRPIYLMCTQVAPAGECLRGKTHLIGLLAVLGAVCFWQPTPSEINLVVAAVLPDNPCAVSLLPCIADCCIILFNVVSWSALIKRRLLLLLL